jgi:acetyl esterase/lipase
MLTRRELLGGIGASAMAFTAGCSYKGYDGVSDAATKHRYGTDPSQYCELYLPTGDRKPTTFVIIHGGFWRAEYGADLGAPLAADLAKRGYAAWNMEYRRVGNGGGWTSTFDDVAAGIDLLTSFADVGITLDLEHVVAIGHSAGGQLATWAAGRPGLPAGAPGSNPAVRITGVVSQAGVLDLVRAANEGVGGSAVPDLLGGSPSAQPDRYTLASPQARIPLAVPVRCVHSQADESVPFSQSTGYVTAATAAGEDARLVEVRGEHLDLIDPSSSAWRAVIDLLPDVSR